MSLPAHQQFLDDFLGDCIAKSLTCDHGDKSCYFHDGRVLGCFDAYRLFALAADPLRHLNPESYTHSLRHHYRSLEDRHAKARAGSAGARTLAGMLSAVNEILSEASE
jgi:hypothetical protein